MTPSTDYAEIRDAVRALCAQFPDEYFRKIDADRVYLTGLSGGGKCERAAYSRGRYRAGLPTA